MSVKIIFEDDEWIEYEFTQPNDLVGNTEWWTDQDWEYWKDKMDKLEKEGTKGQEEILKIKLKKNPFLDGTNFGANTERIKTNNRQLEEGRPTDETSGSET